MKNIYLKNTLAFVVTDIDNKPAKAELSGSDVWTEYFNIGVVQCN